MSDSGEPGAGAQLDDYLSGIRPAYPVLDAVANAQRPPRLLVVGTKGAGKSTALRRMHRLLIERGRTVVTPDPSGRMEAISQSEIVLVDDAHQLPEASIKWICDWAANPRHALLVALRPWPSTEALDRMASVLGHSVQTIVGGRLNSTDLMPWLRPADGAAKLSCAKHLVSLTGGIAWLASTAVAMHGRIECEDERHVALEHHLVEMVSHLLTHVDPNLLRAIQRVALDPSAFLALDPSDADDMTLRAYSEGLVLRDGSLPQVVQTAVQTTIPSHRLIDLVMPDEPKPGSGRTPENLGASDKPTAAGRLDMLRSHHTDSLLQHAEQFGLSRTQIAERRIPALWKSGQVESAARLLDELIATGQDLSDELVSTMAATWASRMMMDVASEYYASSSPAGSLSQGSAFIANIGVGRVERLTSRSKESPKRLAGGGVRLTTASVALDLIEHGLSLSLQPDRGEEALTTLVRASKLYSRTGSASPLPELPAVIAANAALAIGHPGLALAVVDEAIGSRQGGLWGRRQLRLWRAWAAVCGERPGEAVEALEEASSLGTPWTERDRFLDLATQIILVRRFRDPADLEALWEKMRLGLRSVQFDLYLLLQLAELVVTGARLDDDLLISPHVESARRLLERLGEPPFWSNQLNWAGVQRAIILDRPKELTPFARRLAVASANSSVADAMTNAGRVWAAVMSGGFEPSEVESAAESLADVGLSWDGARLAAQGAARAKDRQVTNALLACARRLHPRTASPQRRTASDGSSTDNQPSATESRLSARELEVAVLMIQGNTYAEIGKKLFISPRTVEHHVARMRQRLGVGKRSELLVRLRALDEVQTASSEPPGASGSVR